MAVTVDDVVEAAANGVIRALDARKAGEAAAPAPTAGAGGNDLVRSGFFVEVHIRAGGLPAAPNLNLSGGVGQE